MVDAEKQGLLLIGHGTRDPAGQAEMAALAARAAAALAPIACEAGNLEFAAPTIAQAIARLVERGAETVTALPLLLFAAGHVKQDIPRELAQESARHGGLPIRAAGYLGCHPQVIELSALRYSEALARAAAEGTVVDPQRTLLLLVGRGSRDPEANAEMARFARLRYERTPVGWCEICFTAMCEPSLERGLEFAAATRFDQIVVQPHLLFRGELLDRVRDAVELRRRMGEKSWLLAEHLGDHELLARAAIQIAGLHPTLRS